MRFWVIIFHVQLPTAYEIFFVVENEKRRFFLKWKDTMDIYCDESQYTEFL
jgi:hypothetical protein